MNKFPLLLLGMAFLIVGIIFLFQYSEQPEFKIFHTDSEEELNYIIEIVNCSNIKEKNESVLVPWKYKKQSFIEDINSTHYQKCWYKPIFKENLTIIYLNENCEEIKKDEFLCPENFSVFVR
ncbi:MAG: hypothetical protein ACOC3Z_03435 [Nanoarchaeota archaeon]